MSGPGLNWSFHRCTGRKQRLMGFTRIRRYYLTSPSEASSMIYPTLHLKASKMKNLYLLSCAYCPGHQRLRRHRRWPGRKECGCGEGKDYSMSREVIPKLVGSWKLISFHSKDSSGQTSYPFGKDAQGRLIYEPDGRMAVQLMNPNRPRFASDDPLVTSEAEVRAAFDGYTAYYGTYSVNPDEQTIVHHIEVALLPNWVGTDQRRDFEFDGKYLTLKGPLTPA